MTLLVGFGARGVCLLVCLGVRVVVVFVVVVGGGLCLNCIACFHAGIKRFDVQPTFIVSVNCLRIDLVVNSVQHNPLQGVVSIPKID